MGCITKPDLHLTISSGQREKKNEDKDHCQSFPFDFEEQV